MRTLRKRLPGTAVAAREARRLIDEAFGSASGETGEILRLLVSEVVSNAVRHADLKPDDTVDVSLEVRQHCVMVEVRQPGPSFSADQQRSTAPLHEEGGLGFHILDGLTSRWGVSSNPTKVWFEVPC